MSNDIKTTNSFCMKESEITKALEIALEKNGKRTTYKSRTGSLLFFNDNYISTIFAERFKIEYNRGAFESAFSIVTNGVGNEASKINSLTSSSLLSLLFFYPLFGNENQDLYIEISINGIKYRFVEAFYEVRNKVVGYPSCIDVVLKSTDGTLLFLESKFTEFLDDRKKSKSYGSSYFDLYKSIKSYLEEGGLTVNKGADGSLVIESSAETYIEGIKQNISHLIGLVKGPQDVIDGSYDADYLNRYKLAYETAKKTNRLFYGTILFNSCSIVPEAQKYYNQYVELYENIIGKNSNNIIREIFSWCKLAKDFSITVYEKPITYQELFSWNPTYMEVLSHEIKYFYGFID